MVLQVWDSRGARRKIGLTKGPGGGAWRGRMASTTHKTNPGFFVLIRSLRVFEPAGRPNLHALRPRNGPNRPSAEAGPAERSESACLEGGPPAPYTEVAGTCIANGSTWDFSHRFFPLAFGPHYFGYPGSKGPRRCARGSALGAQSMNERLEVRRRMPT